MKLLFVMTYYRPYVSGPIIYVENLGRELVRRGHEVTILTSHHLPQAPASETDGGMHIVRLPVMARLSKGVLMRGLLKQSRRLMQAHDAVLIQAPQFEAAALALVARMNRTPSLLTYHCDVLLPPGLLNRAITAGMKAIHLCAARLVDHVVAYTQDYATYSAVMSRYLDKVVVIPPPVFTPEVNEDRVREWRRQFPLSAGPIVGICGRLTTEKGFPLLLEAIGRLRTEFPTAQVLHAGDTETVVGETELRDAFQRRLRETPDCWIATGVLGPEELACFYRTCNVTVLPSINHTESFGLVQVESMLNGTPVVASMLRGVRVPVQTTGMGKVVPVGDVGALAVAIREVVLQREQYVRPAEDVAKQYSISRTADDYERLLHKVTRR